MATQLLLIEDDVQIRNNVAELLILSGFQVATAANGREGITQALLVHPNLILCDIMMPDVDGYQVLEAMRDIRSLASVPFIFLTAKIDSVHKQQGLLLGADDYLTKPFGIDGLLRVIENRLQRAAARQADLQTNLQTYQHPIRPLGAHADHPPLGSIIGLTTLLIENDGAFNADQQRSILATIKASGQQLKRSLDRQQLMAELAQVDSTQATYASYRTGLTLIDAEGIDKQLLLVRQWQDKPVDVQCEVASATVGLSSENLAILLTEVLDNAFKFSDASVPIQITGHQQGRVYHLSIRNQGQAFDPVAIEQLGSDSPFEPHPDEPLGYGLGLSIVKKLLTLTQGQLQIGTDLPGQTTLSLLLPIALPANGK